MSAQAVLSELASAGVDLYLDGDRLRFRAPAGTMTDQRRALVAAHRDALVALLAAAPVDVAGAAELEEAGERVDPVSPIGDTEPAADSDRHWPPRMAELIARLEQVEVAALPASFALRPGITVSDPTRFLAGLRAQVAHGPGALRARRGLVQIDLEDLMHVLANPEGARLPMPAPAHLKPFQVSALEGTSPGEHLAQLGGYQGAQRVAGERAHRLWDTARLWERDQGTPSAARWEAEYWRLWAMVQAGTK